MFSRLSDAAEANLVEITDYIAQRDPPAAARVLDLCLDRFAMLVRQPPIGEACEHLAPGLRQFTAGRYVIFYRVKPDTDIVDIVRVLHGARDIEAIIRRAERN